MYTVDQNKIFKRWRGHNPLTNQDPKSIKGRRAKRRTLQAKNPEFEKTTGD